MMTIDLRDSNTYQISKQSDIYKSVKSLFQTCQGDLPVKVVASVIVVVVSVYSISVVTDVETSVASSVIVSV